ncbi:MAG: ankyrin repeat domain-containing protein, partial [Elusimicrobiaceae bacterium]|nr:ankyrin repeat domain-containing protein [Elusimicrobiaceae bacterium]
ANALKQKVEKQIEEISKTETVTPLKTPSTPTPGKKDIDAVDENGFTELMHAAMIGDLARGEELLKAGADINTVNPDMFRDTALMLAIQFHQSKFANFLMENGADVNIANSMGITSLMVAAAVGDLTTALRLMKRGANLEAKSRNGHTAWDIAWKNGHFKVANAIENAANAASINAVDENGYTELMHAAMIGDLARGEELLKAGADINFVNPLPWQGDSALMIAIIYKQPEFADFLIENGIDVNIVNFRGQTALMYAAQEGYLPLVEKLTKKGANVNAADLFGNTAFKMARGAEVRDQLVKSGAK